MELNKDHALRLWTCQFGRRAKAIDYAGRRIDKASYNDRNSKYGWNVDHILPQSRGGKTADHNLICCSILTNDEKADRFPCFRANDKNFEIRRIQNHYEIFPRTANDQREVNFFDPGQAIEYWETDDEIPDYVFVGYVKIRLTSKTPMGDEFLERFRNILRNFFHTSAVFADGATWDPSMDCTFTVINFDVPQKKDAQNLLDACILLNTYGQFYFQPKYGCELRIFCGVHPYQARTGFTAEEITRDIFHRHCGSLDTNHTYFLAIHGMIKTNTSADSELTDRDYHPDLGARVIDCGEGFFPYNKFSPNVKKMLEKQI